jgi:hypothetical protein
MARSAGLRAGGARGATRDEGGLQESKNEKEKIMKMKKKQEKGKKRGWVGKAVIRLGNGRPWVKLRPAPTRVEESREGPSLVIPWVRCPINPGPESGGHAKSPKQDSDTTCRICDRQPRRATPQ